MLLLGPPGIGKTHFRHRVAELLGAAHTAVRFDQQPAQRRLALQAEYKTDEELIKAAGRPAPETGTRWLKRAGGVFADALATGRGVAAVSRSSSQGARATACC